MVDHGAGGQVLHGRPEGTPGVLELGQRPGEVEPVRHVLEPFLVVERDQVIPGDVARVGVDGDQGYPTSRGPEDGVGLPELCGDDGAVRRANRVEECQGDCSAAQAGERYWATVLVDQTDGGLRDVEGLGEPSTAWVRRGSALSLVAARAIGAVPTRVIAERAYCSSRSERIVGFAANLSRQGILPVAAPAGDRSGRRRSAVIAVPSACVTSSPAPAPGSQPGNRPKSGTTAGPCCSGRSPLLP